MVSVIVYQDDSDGHLKFLAEEARKGNDNSFMDIKKEFPCIYNCACRDFKDWKIKANAWRKICSSWKNPRVSKDMKAHKTSWFFVWTATVVLGGKTLH